MGCGHIGSTFGEGLGRLGREVRSGNRGNDEILDVFTPQENSPSTSRH